MASFPDEKFFQWIAELGPVEPQSAPARLKAKVYSLLVKRQGETGPLMSLTECSTQGRKLCLFEHLVRIAPVGETIKSRNICRACHARVLAEHVENAPIYWRGCPYVDFQNS